VEGNFLPLRSRLSIRKDNVEQSKVAKYYEEGFKQDETVKLSVTRFHFI
jgi:hypothetical protein